MTRILPRLLALTGFVPVLLLPLTLSAQADGLALKMDRTLRSPAVIAANAPLAPLFVTADQIETTAPQIIEASGKVEARQSGRNFFADWLRYDTAQNTVDARGQVRIEQPSMQVDGDTLNYNLNDYSGSLTQPHYALSLQNGRGHADQIDFIDANHSELDRATYTTCPVGNDDWYLKVDDLELDRSRQVGTAHHATVNFLGVPILYTPWMNFPLNDARKSGLLAPTLGLTERSGVDILLPYYLNLAPNYDATLYPRLLSKRGLQLGGEFRYLLGEFNGVNRLEYLPDDSVLDRSRWSAVLNNAYTISPGTQAGFTYSRVSDDDYFRDLSNLIAITSITNLNREVWLTTQHTHWNAELRVQSFQTLQDSTAATTVAEPYARLPHARLGVAQTFGPGVEFKLDTSATRFAHPTLTEGTRVLAYPILRMPIIRSYGYLTPQIGWHSSYYSLDDSAPEQQITRNLPIVSLDSGMAFDRVFQFAGGDYEQTLEPRAYYVYAPYRDQSNIPVFDTAQLDFGYAEMFTENQFVGGDRINDANQLTLALTSRFSEADSGLERLQVTLGQRYYFSAQQVTLPGVAPRSSNATDLLLAISGQLNRDWRIDTMWQYDTQNGTTIRQNLSASYRPAPGRVLNMGYRFIDQTTEQVDLSAQWPLWQRWYGMFRYNYSYRDNKLVEGLAGIEYNGGCWQLRTAFQRLATKEDQSTDSLFFQLELNGMGRLGSDPLSVLKQSVPGYLPSNEFTDLP